MTKRSYDQYCGIAVALDLVGERWTMLLVRNLLVGPKRFKDLYDGLPGISTGLLSDRLKQLEQAGIVERAVLPPPAATVVYQLTADGEQLRPVLIGLARWGMARLGRPGSAAYADPDIIAVALEARFAPDSDIADASFALIVDDRAFHLRTTAGTLRVTAGPTPAPIATMTTSQATLFALNAGEQTVSEALENQAIALEGDIAAALQLARAFGLPA